MIYPHSIQRAKAFLCILPVLVSMFAGIATAQPPPFVDTFDGPTLDPEWTALNPGSHPGFNGSGQYVVDGVHQSDAGLRRTMGGTQGDFIAEVSLELGPFFLGGAGGTKTDFKVRFNGSGGLVEIVLNSFKDIRVFSSELGGNLAPQVRLNSLSENDQLDLQLNYIDSSGTVDVKYAINGGAWQDLVSATGITGHFYNNNSDLIMFKFDNNPATLPQMRLDHYEIRDNSTAPEVPVANPDSYETVQDTTLVVPAPGVLTNDVHPGGVPITAALVSNATVGTVVSLDPNGSFEYEPLAGHTGFDSFTYSATDGTNASAPALVTIQVTPAPLQVMDFEALSPGTGDYRIVWNSLPEKSYAVQGISDLVDTNWQFAATNLLATPPTNTYVLSRTPATFENFRVMEEGSLPWPNTDYCSMLSQEIQGKKHGFLAGNLVYYVGGQYATWNIVEHETIGLSHPFFHDLRSRGFGIVTNAATGVGHDLTGWEFYKDAEIAYGTVIIGQTEYANPIPTRMYWRPDRMICEYDVGGVSIREEKFISTNDVACSIIKSSAPVDIRFRGQSFVNDSRSIQKTSTQQYDAANNMIQVVEGGTILVRPEDGVDVEGPLMYDGMSTVVSASENFSSTYSGFLDGNGRQQYSFTVPCGPLGVSVYWAMDDVYANARDRVLAVRSDPEGELATKKAVMNDLLNNQIPYFRCSDQDIVNIYYYLWSLYLMYYIDVGEGWEQHPHTQSAVHNFLGMHRYDAAFQIRVGAWTTDKDYYAYGNVLLWSNLLPFAQSNGALPDNMGTTWHSGIYGATTDHPNGAWEIYERSGDTNFLADCYAPYFKPLFWNGISEHFGYMYNAATNLSQMAEVLGFQADVQHWNDLVNYDNVQGYLDARWETEEPHWFLTANPMDWLWMAWMGMEQFPDQWAWEMTEHWATDDVDGFYTEVPLGTRALKDWAGVSTVFTITPDTCWWAIRGMYLHHVGTNANHCALGHLKGYNLEWGIPVAPEALDINFDPWGDHYSNFNAGKLLLILEGIVGVDYSIPDGTFTVNDHMPQDWTFMEFKVPVTQPGQTNWVDVRIDRTEPGGGVIEKTVSVNGNPLPTLEIQPWLEERVLISAPAGSTNAPTNHLAYTFLSTTNKTLAIQIQQ